MEGMRKGGALDAFASALAIKEHPENFGALNFKVTVDKTAGIDHVRNIYINAGHTVFDLVPPSLGTFIEDCYNELGRPLVDLSSVWTVYLAILQTLQDSDHGTIQGVLSAMDTDKPPVEDDELPLIGGLQDLPMNDDEYMGGVGNGMGLEPEHHRALDELDDDDDPLPSGFEEAALEIPALLINAFSDDDMSDEDDFANNI